MKKLYPAISVFMLMAAQTAGREVNMDFAENSWPRVVTDGGVVVLVGQTRQVEGPRPMGLNQQQGTAVVTVIRELTPGLWHGGPELSVRFTQLASWKSRLREGNGGWNGVDVRGGVMLLMALARGQNGDNSAPVPLEAVSQISSPDDSQVAAVAQALHIEATQAQQERLRLLQQALNSGMPVLESYAHFALGRKQRVPRAEAAALEITLLLDATKPETNRLAAESTLELELWADADPHDEVNKSITSALLQVLARQDPHLQRPATISLYRLLFSSAPSDPAAAQMYRSELLKDVKIPDVQALRTALRELQKDTALRRQAEELMHLF